MNAGLRGHQFVKEGAEEVLELIASLAPRMEQAASQIQDSRDLSLPLLLAISAKSSCSHAHICNYADP